MKKFLVVSFAIFSFAFLTTATANAQWGWGGGRAVVVREVVYVPSYFISQAVRASVSKMALSAEI